MKNIRVIGLLSLFSAGVITGSESGEFKELSKKYFSESLSTRYQKVFDAMRGLERQLNTINGTPEDSYYRVSLEKQPQNIQLHIQTIGTPALKITLDASMKIMPAQGEQRTLLLYDFSLAPENGEAEEALLNFLFNPALIDYLGYKAINVRADYFSLYALSGFNFKKQGPAYVAQLKEKTA